MAKKTNREKPLYSFLADVRRVAYHVSQHADRMSAAHAGPHRRRDRERDGAARRAAHPDRYPRLRTVVPSSRELVREASRLITTIGIAARYSGKTNPPIAESLARTRRGPERRAAAASPGEL